MITLKSILYVDDEPEFVSTHIAAVKDAGYDVVQEDNPNQVLKRLANGELYDLFILDLLMPPLEEDESKHDTKQEPDMRRTGVRLHEKIRAIHALKKVPIIFLSIVRDPAVKLDIERIEGNGEHHFVIMRKPILPSELVDQVDELLRSDR